MNKIIKVRVYRNKKRNMIYLNDSIVEKLNLKPNENILYIKILRKETSKCIICGKILEKGRRFYCNRKCYDKRYVKKYIDLTKRNKELFYNDVVNNVGNYLSDVSVEKPIKTILNRVKIRNHPLAGNLKCHICKKPSKNWIIVKGKVECIDCSKKKT